MRLNTHFCWECLLWVTHSPICLTFFSLKLYFGGVMLDKLCWTFALCTALPCLLLHLRPQHTTLLAPFFFFPSLSCHHSLWIFFSLASSVLIQTVSLCCGSCGRWRTNIHQHKARVPYYVCVCLCMYVCVVLHVGSCGLEGPCSWPVGEGAVQTYFNIIVPWNMHEHTHIEETLQHCGFSFITSSNIGKPPRFKLTFPVPPRPQLSLHQCQADVAVVLLSGIIVDLLEKMLHLKGFIQIQQISSTCTTVEYFHFMFLFFKLLIGTRAHNWLVATHSPCVM